METSLIQILLVVLVSLFGASLLIIMLHGAWLSVYGRWSQRRIREARALVAQFITRSEPDSALAGDPVVVLQRMPRALQRQVLLELARNLTGDARDRSRDLARRIGLTAWATARGTSMWWWRRLGAVRLLTTLGRDREAVMPFLTDPHPAVVAQAAEWAGERPTPRTVSALVRALARGGTQYRFAVQSALLHMGGKMVGPLAEWLNRGADGPEVVPVLEVAAAVPHPAFLPSAMRLSRSAHPAVRAAAADVIGAVQGADGAEALTALLVDVDPLVRAHAARALGRIGHWPAAATLATLVRDPAFGVRRAAGLSLRSLGSPGQLMLARLRAGNDRLAADMARHVLDLPVPGPERG